MTEQEAKKVPVKKGVSRREFIAGTVGGVVIGAAVGTTAGSLAFPAPKGATGAQGLSGPQGPAGPVGAAGAPATPVIASKELTCDVLVVGGGTAGFLTAAIKAIKDGAKVIVIEKAPALGGTGMVSNSSCHFGGGTDAQKAAGIVDTPEKFYADMRAHDVLADPDALKGFTDNAVPCCNFLTSCGLTFILDERGLAPVSAYCDAQTVPRIHYANTPNGWYAPGMFKTLIPVFTGAGGTILTGTRGVKLVTDVKGAVVGCIASDKDGYFKINAKATILACGGFENNVEMLAKYLGINAPYGMLRDPLNATGDGMLMGLEVGAATKAMWRVHGHIHIVQNPMPYPFQPFAIVPPDAAHGYSYEHVSLMYQGTLDSVGPYCIYVNIRGERFADETRTYFGDYMTAMILQQPEARAYLICDKPMYDSMLNSNVVAANGYQKMLGYPPVQVETANTIEDLATKVGMYPSVLSSTVSEYNKAVDDGTTPLLPVPKASNDPLGLLAKYKIDFNVKIVTAPFYAVHVTGALSHTHGALYINGKGEVVDRGKKPIPGLYAAGDCGSFWHDGFGTGGGFGGALVMGYNAAQNAVQYVKTLTS